MTPPYSPLPRATPEDLLAERAWVRRVARALARDDADADDLAQDAWIAALRSPPETPATARGWFRSVLRNRLLERARGDARRARREEATARAEAEPSTADIVARAEAHRRVVEAVFALDDPLRTTLVLRFFEELSAAEIGQRMAVPADTVRSRVRRALALLRERLADPDDRRRDAWALLLLAPDTGVEGAAIPGGIAVTSTATKFAAAAVCALLLAGAAFWVLRDGTEGAAGGASQTARAGTNTSSEGDAARGARERTATKDPGDRFGETGFPSGDPTQAAAVHGEVRFVAPDRPAASVEVTLSSGAHAVRTTTDAAGAFRFDRVPAGLPLTATARSQGFAATSQAGVRLSAGETRRLPVFRLDAPIGAVIRVVAPDGSPIAAARVEAYRERARIEQQDWSAALPEPELRAETDAKGSARVADLSVGTWTFRATHPDYAAGGTPPTTLLRGGVPLVLVVRLEQGHALTGTITGTDGRPVAGALVLALPPVEAETLMTPVPIDPRRVEAPTDAEGRYRFAALRGGDHSLALVRAGSLPCRLGIVSIPSVSRFDATLDGGALTGRVTDETTGRPVEGARVHAAVWRRHSPTYLSAVTGPDGRYRLDVPLGGILQGPARGEGEARSLPVHFDVEKEGFVYAPEMSATPWRNVFVFGGDTMTVDAVLRPAATLAGRVLAPEGPVADAEVVADVWSALRGSLPARTTTDSEGRYRFPGLPEGRARLVVTSAGHFQKASPGDGWRGAVPPDPAAVVVIPRAGDVTFDVQLAAGASLRGCVVDDADGAVPGARIDATAGGDVLSATTTAADGSFEITGLRPDAEAGLRVSAPGFVDAEERAAAGADAKPVTIVLARLGNVSGRVVRADGTPAPGAWVQVVPAKRALDEGYEIVSVWTHAVRHPVASDGAFDAPVSWMGGAAADGVVVRAGAPGLAPALSERIATPRGAPADAGTLKLEAGHRLQGRVVAADGSGPIAGAEIEFQNEKLPPALSQRRDWSQIGRDQTPFEWVARTDAQGNFEVDGLPAWRYELRVNATGFDGAAPIAAVPQDEPVTVELARLAPLTGHVEYEDATPAAGLIVIAHPESAPTQVAGYTEAGADGRFHLPFLGAGRYALEARRAWDRAMDVLPTTTDPVQGGRDDVKIVVRRGGASISGRCVTASGAAVPGAVIRAKPAQGAPVLITRSAPDGRFTMSSLEGGPWSLSADANRAVGGPEGYGRQLVAQLTDVASGARDVVLEFREAAPIRGKVLRDDGSVPPGQIIVQAKTVGADGPASQWMRICPLFPDGSFRFDNATAGTWALTVIDQASGAKVRVNGPTEVAGGTLDVKLVVAASASIAGRVVDGRGLAVQHARVTARRDGAPALDAVTDAEGRFQWGDVSDGAWTLVASHDEAGRSDATAATAGASDITLSLRPQDALTARVTQADGAPLRDAVVAVTPAAGGDPLRLRTDSEGRFTTRALAPGEFEVALVERDGRAVRPATALGTVRSGARDAVLQAH